jgi:hypothetical protein
MRSQLYRYSVCAEKIGHEMCQGSSFRDK